MAEEYIRREALQKELQEELVFKSPRYTADQNKHIDIGLKIALRAIKRAPAADVVEVKHGCWVGVEYDGYADGIPVYDLWECSECGEEVSGEDVPDTHPFCHGCGAKMDGATEDKENENHG